MVCPSDDCITAVVTDESSINANISNDKEPLRLKLLPTTTVDDIFNKVANYYDWDPKELKLQINDQLNHVLVLNDYKRKTLAELNVDFKMDYTISVQSLVKNSPNAAYTSDDDLLLTTSDAAVRKSSNVTTTTFAPNIETTYINSERKMARKKYPIRSNLDSCNYVGLVNQAMTCYLNSLIQALFMTPEFRNALYNWEFDGQQIESKSIPFQLQKLFLNLQVCSKNYTFG